ncbi:MAG: VCBS repeat-containing protein [Thermodesulfobacteriota bacterium]
MYNVLKKCVICFLLFCLFSTPALARESERLVCYPTDVSKAGELSYLRDSVRLMLASRIAAVTGVEIRLERRMDTKRDGSSYRMKSRLVSSGDGVELSATVFTPASDSPRHFQSRVDEKSEVMRGLELLAADIGRSLFSEAKAPANTKSKKIAEQGEEEGVSEVDAATAHPDRTFKASSGYGLSIAQDEFIAQMAVEVQTTERYKSRVLDFQSQGMSAGDIDGDSHVEIVVSTHGKLLIYRLQDPKIDHVDTISLPGGLRVHALNVADLDGNGLMEIYVSSTRNRQAHSFVLEWQPETGEKWLHKDVRWYLRPMELPGEGQVLVGQTSGMGEMIGSEIYRMNVEPGEKISRGEAIGLPKTAGLFDFVYADLDGNKLFEIVRINRKEELEVYSSDLQLLYTSPAGFSGRELGRELTVPIRLVAFDFDSDGGDDIFVVDNQLSSPKILPKSKLYKNGQVRGLSWDGTAFFEMWHTNVFRNSVVDYFFLPSAKPSEITGNSAGNLFVVEPEKGDWLEGFLFERGGSRVYAYGVEFVRKR